MKRNIKHYIQVTLLPYILSLLVRVIYLTNKKTFHHPKDIPNEPFILAMWHNQLLMQALNYRYFKKDGTIKVIVSEHRDGEMIRKIVSYLGVGALSGSSTRGGAKALIGAIKTIKNGIDVAITPDGPRGPIYEIADGIVAISNKTNAKILTCKIIPSRFWTAKSWDKFIVPKPFGTIDFYIGEPFSIEGLSMEDAKNLIKLELGK
jgi:lysophospholipid acyltransferase (LPLAT)-like uncharacterized protein